MITDMQVGSRRLYTPESATVTHVCRLGKKEKLFEIRLDSGRPLGHKPGQFVQVSVLGVGEAPISISSSPSRSNGGFQLAVREVGNVTGALIGGFLLGIAEILIVAFFPHLAGYRDAFAYSILILLLLFRPTGIMGEVEPEKV